jgi:hypothetical protein
VGYRKGPRIGVRTADAAYRRTLRYAGATLPVRDAVDERIVREIETGSGRLIDSQNEVGGWPQYAQAPAPHDGDSDGMPDAWEMQNSLCLTDHADHAQDADSDGYTNLEEFLNSTNPFVSDG